VNACQKSVLLEKIIKHFAGKLVGLTIGVWGLAFKPSTDDIREAPSLVLIEGLLARGAKVRVYDPEAMENVRARYGARLEYCDQRDGVLDGADALAIVTEWKHFINPDFDAMRRAMRQPIIFDGRNLYRPERMKQAGFTYYSIGRPAV
jgi:UDPglucose 6-dehydrogenase